MATNKVPTLIIGIGGIGCRIAANVNQMLSEEDRKYVGAVGIDTNVSDLTTVSNLGLQTIRIGDDRLVGTYLSEHFELREWFQVHPLLKLRGMKDGAGQIRMISRLAALSSEKRGDFAPIESEIKRITQKREDGSRHNLAVVVVGSITGGTGAGMCVQLPYYIRNLVRNTMGMERLIIRGMFLGADLTRSAQSNAINRQAVGANAYSCIKELNALYMTQMFPELAEKIKLDFFDDRAKEDYDIEWDAEDEESVRDKEILSRRSIDIPYDYLYLLEGSTAHGGLGNPSLGTIEKTVARTLFTLLFTPVINQSLSVEDNFTLPQISESGMSRYASSGLCQLVYPAELAREYVVLANAKEMVDQKWRLVDKKCEEAVSTARARKSGDGRTEIPEMDQNYCSHFEAAVGIGERARGIAKPPLAELFSEVCTKGDVGSRDVLITEQFMAEIDETIRAAYETDDMDTAEARCKLEEKDMGDLDRAATAIATLETNLKKYEQMAEQVVAENYARIANDLFPSTVVGMLSGAESDSGIYRWIAKLHPVAARYFCYSLGRMLKQRIEQAKLELADVNLKQYSDSDFDEKTAAQDSAIGALQNIKDKSNPFYKMLVSDTKKTKKLTTKIRSLAMIQVKEINTWMQESLYLNVCQILLERVEKLSANYKLFFDTLGTMIEINDERMKDLEDLKFPVGEVGVYCSAQAMRRMAAVYAEKNEMVLPDDVKKELFLAMFRVTASDMLAPVSESDYEREKREMQNKAALTGAFDNAVMKALRADVKNKGDAIVNLTVKQALEKEYELTSGVRADLVDPAVFHAQVTEYITDRVNDAMRMASPMLAVDAGALDKRAELVFFAVHPDCAERRKGVPDEDATKEAYFAGLTDASGNSPVHVLMNEEFSPYEMTCVRTQYLFKVDALINYGPESLNARDYFDRVNNIDGKIVDLTCADAFKTVVSPHLDRHWHEEGFVPPLTETERKKFYKDKFMAFAYAVGMDLARLWMDEDALYTEGAARYIWTESTDTAAKPIRVSGCRIPGTYHSLLDSLDYNRNMKKRFLKVARAEARRLKGFASGDEMAERIMDTEFIADLIQSSTRADDMDKNVYDIFMEMRDSVPATVFTKLFEGLLNALWEYNGCLLDKSVKLVNKATKTALEAILANCAVGKKLAAGEALTYGERALVEEHNTLMGKVYHG